MRQLNRNNIFLLFLIQCMLLCEEEEQFYFYGLQYHSKAANPSFGIGKGRGIRKKRRVVQPKNVWKVLKDEEYKCKQLLHISPEEFKRLVQDMEGYMRR